MGGRELYVLRHAKTEVGNGKDDHARALVPCGVTHAHRLGAWMTAHRHHPSHALCSTATRTRQTLEALQTELQPACPVHYTRDLYMASPGEIFQIVNQHGEDAQALLVVAHNPGVHLFCQSLDDAANTALSRELAGGFPTCTLAIFGFSGNWRDLAPGNAKLISVRSPG